MRNYFVLICLFSLAPSVLAGVYKYVDEQGNTVYTDTKPKESSDVIETINVNETYTNTIPSSAVSGSNSQANSRVSDGERPGSAEISKPTAQDLAITNKKARLAAKKTITVAQKNLEASKVIRQGDMFPNPGGGIRYTQQYHQRVESAQKRLNDAQKRFNQL